jgi:hypothetical protein
MTACEPRAAQLADTICEAVAQPFLPAALDEGQRSLRVSRHISVLPRSMPLSVANSSG